jgi:hypothetical protein
VVFKKKAKKGSGVWRTRGKPQAISNTASARAPHYVLDHLFAAFWRTNGSILLCVMADAENRQKCLPIRIRRGVACAKRRAKPLQVLFHFFLKTQPQLIFPSTPIPAMTFLENVFGQRIEMHCQRCWCHLFDRTKNPNSRHEWSNCVTQSPAIDSQSNQQRNGDRNRRSDNGGRHQQPPAPAAAAAATAQ